MLSALIGGTLINAVAAAPAPSGTTVTTPPAAAPSPAVAAAAAREPSKACTTFRAAFAANLGKTEAEVLAAAKAAIATSVDAAVADGTITAENAAKIKTRVAAADADGCRILSGRRDKAARGALHVARDGFEAAAQTLDLTPKALRAELRAGKDLKDVAAARNVPYATVSAAVLAAVDKDLDAAVAAGTLKKARADRILERIERRLAAGWSRGGNGAGDE